MPKSTFTRTVPLVAVAATLAVAGCGGGSSGSAATSGTVQGAITYSFWGSPARAEKVNKVIALYQQKTPGVTVTGEVSDYASYIEKMTVKAAGGGLACAIGTQSTFYAPYAQKDVLLPLDDLIASKAIDVSAIPKEVLAAGQIDGKQYMIPTGTFVRLAAYNVDMVKAAGAPAPTDDMTWEQHAAWLKQVQAGLPKGKYATEIGGSSDVRAHVVGRRPRQADVRRRQARLRQGADGAVVPVLAGPDRGRRHRAPVDDPRPDPRT